MADKLVNDGSRWEKVKEKPKVLEDDGSKYIFPAGEAAPGSNIAPAAADMAPPDVSAFTNPEVQTQPAAQSATTFVNPSAPASVPARDVAGAPPIGSTPSAAPEIPSASSGNAAIDAYGKESQEASSQLEKLNQERAAHIQKSIADDEKAVEQIDPKTYFEGKNTWQKVLGGIGMFLGSITPEGAKNVASIVEKEINRDIEVQKMNIKLRQDKKDSTYNKLLQKYGSEEAALLAKKKGAFDLMDLQLKKLELNSRNAETRARLSMGREELDLKRQGLSNALQVAMMKQHKEDAKGSVPGYVGAPLDAASKKAFSSAVASADTIKTSLTQLKTLISGTGESIPFTQKNDRAKQLVNDVQLRLKDILNLGVLSESDAGRLEKYVSNPSLFTSDKRALNEIEGVLKLVATSVDSHARSLGLSKPAVTGAREIQ